MIPTRNRFGLLRETLATVLSQSLAPNRVIVSDDGSDPAALRAFLDDRDPRVELVGATVSGGVSAARNRGLAACDGDWVAFCDDDDLWAEDKLEAQWDAVHDAGAHWCFVHTVAVDARLGVIGVNRRGLAGFDEALYRHNPVPGGGSGVLARRDALVALGGFDVGLAMFADWDLWIRLRAVGPPAVADTLGLLYRLHGAQMSMDADASRKELARMARKHPLRTDRNGRLPAVDTWILGRLRRAGRWRDALAYAREASDTVVDPVRLRRQAVTLGHVARKVVPRRRRPEARAVVRAVANRVRDSIDGASA